MATEDVYVRGKGSYIYAYVPDQQFEKPAWKITLHPDDASLATIQQLKKEGMKNWEKRDDDGTYFTFKRPVTVLNKKSGKDISLSPPVVLDHEGQPFTGPIGNGSDVTVKLEVYSHNTPGGGKAKAARFAALRIDSLVPFETKRDFTDTQKEVVGGLADQPKPRPF